MQNQKKKQIYLSQFSLALGGFAIGTCDFVVGGLLPELARATSVNIPTAGQYIANYAMGVLFGAPILALCTAKLNRKILLLFLLLFFSFINFLCIFSGTYTSFSILRFLAGLPHGIYFGVACVAAAAMVEEKRKPRAVANVVLGMTLSSLIGVPFAVFLGQVFGWEKAYVFITGIGLFSFLLIFYVVPSQLDVPLTTPFGEIRILKQIPVLLLLFFIVIESAGLPSILSYLKMILITQAGFSLNSIPAIMPIVGVGMLFANLLGPKITQNFGSHKAIFTIIFASFLVYIAFYFLCQNPIGALLGCFFLGISFAAFPAIQTRMLVIAKGGQTLGSALMQSAFYTANAIGAKSGGFLIMKEFSYSKLSLLAACFSVLGFIIFIFYCFFEKKQKIIKPKKN